MDAAARAMNAAAARTPALSRYSGEAAAKSTTRSADGPARKHAAAAHASSHATASPNGDAPKPRRRSRRSRSGSPYAAQVRTALTSHPTDRNAYAETRVWLLAEHGPVCAYCGLRFDKASMTLDHVAPRRGQTAYDRRDNLVLACQPCNAAKRDLAPAAFLLGNRNRALNLLRYGSHLSPMLVDLARSLIPPGTVIAAPIAAPASAPAAPSARIRWDDEDDGDSPYKD